MAAELEAAFRDGTWYPVRVESIYADESANSGTPGIIILWTVTEGDMMGKQIQDARWVSDANVARQRKDFLEAFAYDLGEGDNLFNLTRLEGSEAAIKVKIEEWPPNSGKKRPVVGRLRKKGEGVGQSPLVRLAKMFGVEAQAEGDWEADKKF